MNDSIMLLREKSVSKSVVDVSASQLNLFFDLIILDKINVILLRSKRNSSIKKCILSIKKNPDVLHPSMFKNPYILLAYGAPEMSLKNIIELLNIKTIQELETLDEEQLNTIVNRSQSSTLKKISESIVKFKADFERTNKETFIKDIILYYIFSVKEVSKKDSKYLLTKFVMESYPELDVCGESIDKITESLISDNYLQAYNEIIYFPSNIFYDNKFKRPEFTDTKIPLIKYMERDFNDKDLLQYRLKGMTLEEVGKIFGISRERVRQRQLKVLRHFDNVLELAKYKDIFETYFMKKTDFISLFHESPEVYELLRIMLIAGQKDLGYFVLESNKIKNKDKLEYLMNHKFYVTRFGEIKRISKSEFADEVLFSHKERVFTPEDFFKVYQAESVKYSQLGLEIPNSRAAEGVLLRSDYSLFTRGKKFRYYDYNYSEEDWLQLAELINTLDEGCYSTLKIFNENADLMKQLDVHDEYELHNLYKKKIHLLNDSIKMTRSPEFIINNIVKKSFVMNEMFNFSGKSLEKFLDYLYTEYGLKKNTMGAYTNANLKKYINEGIIVSSLEKIDVTVIENLQQHFILPIYMKPRVQEILNYYEQNLTTHLLDQLGYMMTGNVIFLKAFGNTTNAFSNFVFKEKRWRRTEDEVGQSKEMSSYLYKMEADRKIVMLGEGLYYSVSYLENRGISRKMLNDFVSTVYTFLPKKKYFSLHSLKEMGFKHPLIEFGFESILYERLLTTSKHFNPVNRKSPMLFAKGKPVPVTLEIFYSDKLIMFENGIDMYDFIDELDEEFRIEFDLDDIRIRLKRYGAFFSASLEKFYFDKETYLKEVYV